MKLLDRFFGAFSKDLGIDLGTANTLVYVKEKGITINEPSVVAVNTRTDQILAVGSEANKMVGKTPSHITATRPLVDGVISDFEVTEKMLKYFIDKTQKGSGAFFARPRVIIGVPLEVTEVERKAVEDAALSAGARQVFLIEQPVAAAIGAHLPIESPQGIMVVDMGGGTTDIAIIALGGIVSQKSLKIAGNELNEDITRYIRDFFNLLIGERTAEEIKIHIGSAKPPAQPLAMKVRGRDLLSGLPKEIIVNDSQIRDAIMRTLITIIDNVKSTIEKTPPEVVADIYERGMLLTGGGALLKDFDQLIAEATGVPVTIAEDPLTGVVRGTAALLEDEALLQQINVSPTGQR